MPVLPERAGVIGFGDRHAVARGCQPRTARRGELQRVYLSGRC
jgi:hypothetical protein